MAVKSEQVKVYYGGGRRWLTLKGACNAEARAKIMERCECVQENISVGLDTACALHHEDRYPVILRRLARMHRMAYLRAGRA